MVAKGKSREKRGERLMVLRCIIKQKGPTYFTGECLELGLVSEGNTMPECKRNLEEAIEAFIEAAREAKGEYIHIRAIPFYLWRRLCYDLHRCISIKPWRTIDCFKTERSVPVGI